MAVDRGGLQYTIKIKDAFSTPLKTFVSGIKAVRREMDALRKSSKALQTTSKATRDSLKSIDSSRTNTKKRTDELTASERRWTAALRRSRKEIDNLVISRRKSRIAAAGDFRAAKNLLNANEKLEKSHKAVSKVIDKRGEAQRRLSSAQKRGITLSLEEKRALGVLTKQEEALLSAKKALARVRLAGGGEIARIKAETREQRLKNKAIQDELLARSLSAQGLNAQGRTPAQQALLSPKQQTQAKKTISRFERIKKSLKGVGDQANRVSFTFRRLFGILAAFAAARAIFRGFTQLVRETVRFNAAIETATLGVASLFLAVGDVRDIVGETVGSARGLEIAMTIARSQVQLLRRDALKTAATFEALLDTFQVAVAPGFQAGLDIDEIRKFTLDISRAASAIGLAQNQLAEEIRSILSGTIQARTTRIAVALGISNEAIRNAKEAGALFEFLQKKFAAFDEAGEAALKTFNALWTNLLSGFQQVLEVGGLGFFNELKDILSDLFDLIIQQDPISEILTPNPKVVRVFQAFFDSLQSGLEAADSVARTLDLEDLAIAAKAIGTGVVFVVQIIAGIVKGAVAGLRDLAVISSKIFNVFKEFFGITTFDNKSLAETVAIVTELLTVFIGVSAAIAVAKIAMSAFAVIIGGVVSLVTFLNAAFITLRTSAALLNVALLPVGASVAGILAVVASILIFLVVGTNELKNWTDELFDMELKFKSFLKLVKRATQSIRDDFIVQKGADISGNITRELGGIKRFFLVTKGALAEMTAAMFEAKAAQDDIFKGSAVESRKNANDIKERIKLHDKELEQQLKNNEVLRNSEQAAIDKDLGQDIVDILDADATEETVKETVARIAKGAVEGLVGSLKVLFKDLIPDFDDLGLPPGFLNDAETLLDAFDRIGGILGRNREGLKENAELMKKLREEGVKAKDALDLSRNLRGVAGPTAAIITAIGKAQSKLTKESLELEKELETTQKQRAAFVAKNSRNELRILNLSNRERKDLIGILNDTETNLRAIAKLEEQKEAAINAQVLAEIKIDQNRAIGADEAVALAQKESDAFGKRAEALKLEIEAKRESTQLSFDAKNLNEEDAATVTLSVLARIQLSGQLKIIDEQLLAIAKDRSDLALAHNLILSKRLTILAEEAAFTSRTETQPGLQAALIRLQARREADSVLNNAAKRHTLAVSELKAILIEHRIADALRKTSAEALSENIADRIADLKELRIQLENTSASDPNRSQVEIEITNLEREKLALLRLQTEQKKEHAQLRELEKEEQTELIRLQGEALKQLESPISFGFSEAVTDFIDNALDSFTTFKEIVTTGLQGLASVFSTSLTDALAGEGGGFREAFRQFLKRTAEQIINMLISIAIAKALLGLGFLDGGKVPNINIGDALGFAEGGEVKQKKQKKLIIESPFKFAKGFASGGPPLGGGGPVPPSVSSTIAALRPRTVDPRDKVPIWTSPGEWVIKAAAVKLYGADVMDAINGMFVDPSLLRAVSGINASRGNTTRVSSAAASGGEITSRSGAPTVDSSQLGGSGGPSVAILAGDEDTMQQLLVGGGPVLLDFLRTNRDEFMGEERASIR